MMWLTFIFVGTMILMIPGVLEVLFYIIAIPVVVIGALIYYPANFMVKKLLEVLKIGKQKEN